MFPLRQHPRSAWLRQVPSWSLRSDPAPWGKAQAPRKLGEVSGERARNRQQAPLSRRLRRRDQVLGPRKLGEVSGRQPLRSAELVLAPRGLGLLSGDQILGRLDRLHEAREPAPCANGPGPRHSGARARHSGARARRTGTRARHTGTRARHTGTRARHTGRAPRSRGPSPQSPWTNSSRLWRNGSNPWGLDSLGSSAPRSKRHMTRDRGGAPVRDALFAPRSLLEHLVARSSASPPLGAVAGAPVALTHQGHVLTWR
jgi:hypothetical protein